MVPHCIEAPSVSRLDISLFPFCSVKKAVSTMLKKRTPAHIRFDRFISSRVYSFHKLSTRLLLYNQVEFNVGINSGSVAAPQTRIARDYGRPNVNRPLSPFLSTPHEPPKLRCSKRKKNRNKKSACCARHPLVMYERVGDLSKNIKILRKHQSGWCV